MVRTSCYGITCYLNNLVLTCPGTGTAATSPASSIGSTALSTGAAKKTPPRAKHVSAIKAVPSVSPTLLSKFKFSSVKDTARTSSRDAVLRAVRIITPSPHLIFRCAVPGQSTYAEKIWNDDTRASAPWTVALNFEKRLLRWCHEGNEQQNANGHAIRLFVIPLEETPADDAIFEMAQYICDNLNANPSNFTTTTFNKHDFFWIDGPTTWQNVISTSACLDRIFTKCGQPSGTDWWDTHARKVKTYFAPGSVNEHLARRLCAPSTVAHGFFPDTADNDAEEKKQVAKYDQDEDSDDEDSTHDKLGHSMDKDPFNDDDMEYS